MNGIPNSVGGLHLFGVFAGILVEPTAGDRQDSDQL